MVQSSINLTDLDLFEAGPPWSTFKTLRETEPVHFSEEEAPNSGFYSFTRYHDIVSVLRDPVTFTSERFTNLEEVDREQEEARRSLLETDGSRHRALRRSLRRALFDARPHSAKGPHPGRRSEQAHRSCRAALRPCRESARADPQY